MLMDQLLRECPPGFGGVERVAHVLAEERAGVVFSLRPPSSSVPEALPVGYRRCHLPSVAIGRLLVPLPSVGLIALLFGMRPLLVHLPCPTVLIVALLARLLHPARSVHIYWHAFLEPRPGLLGRFEAVYQTLALRWIRPFPVITTSPQLVQALVQQGLMSSRVSCLPCSLPLNLEQGCKAVWLERRRAVDQSDAPRGVLIAIGRLDSYKRIDWLLEAMAVAPAILDLHVVGDGPHRSRWQTLAAKIALPHQRVHFHGRIDERRKLELLTQSDVLVLASDRSNEAFGIVQLEAMAAGIPSLALQRSRSGMHWVSALSALPWQGDRQQLGPILQRLLSDPALYRQACRAARTRYDQVFSLPVWRQQLALVLPGNA